MISGMRWCEIVSLSGFAFAFRVTDVKLIFCCTFFFEVEVEGEVEGGVAFLNAFWYLGVADVAGVVGVGVGVGGVGGGGVGIEGEVAGDPDETGEELGDLRRLE